MFHEFISEVLDNVFIPLLECVFDNDLLTYFFFLGLFGFLISIFRFIISLNNNDLGGRK